MRVAEIIGLPGAGKTTVVERAGSRLGIPVLRKPSAMISGRGLLGRMLATARCPIVSLNLYGLVVFRRNLALEHLRNVFSLQKRYLSVYTRLAASPMLVDEGVIHGVFSATFGTRSTSLSRFFLRRVVRRLVQQGARFYFLDVDKEACARRFEQRTSGSRFSIGVSEQNRQFFLNDCSYREMVDVLRSHVPDAFVERRSSEEMVEKLISDFSER
jgi:hypothetical protein